LTDCSFCVAHYFLCIYILSLSFLWLQAHKDKGVPRDVWEMTLEFVLATKPDLSNFDENGIVCFFVCLSYSSTIFANNCTISMFIHEIRCLASDHGRVRCMASQNEIIKWQSFFSKKTCTNLVLFIIIIKFIYTHIHTLWIRRFHSNPSLSSSPSSLLRLERLLLRPKLRTPGVVGSLKGIGVIGFAACKDDAEAELNSDDVNRRYLDRLPTESESACGTTLYGNKVEHFRK
jgi:hypothetical protein